MNNNQPPEHIPPNEADPSDWSLPISLTATEALSNRLETASDTDTLTTTQDAQTIALCLSDRLGSSLHTAIRQFAEIGSIDAQALRAECLSAQARDELTPGLRRWVAWLITYAARALPPDAGGLEAPVNGDALDVYLRLPDVDPVADDALENFTRHYCGSYSDLDAVLDGITDVREWERKISSLARELGCEEFVSIDRDAIEYLVRDGWDIIPSHSRLHVFFR